MSMSGLETVVYNILVQSKVKFEREKVFSDIYNGYYRYDFYLPEFNCCVEVNGLQHYQYTKFFHKKKSDFTKACERDRRKIRGLAAKHINLYIIPFWEVENLKGLNDLFNPIFLAKTQFHNDIVWRDHQKSIKAS